MIHNPEAETAVLGAMIESPDAIDRASQELVARDFASPRNRSTYAAIMRLFVKGEVVDPITLGDELVRESNRPKDEVRLFIHGILSDFGTMSGITESIRIVAEMAKLRRLEAAGAETAEVARAMPEDVDAAIAEAEWKVMQVAEERGGQQPTRLLRDYFDPDEKEIEAAGKRTDTIGIPTGFPTLDHVCHGWHPGQLIVVGAQTGHLKTTVLTRFAAAAAAKDKRVLFVSLEMDGRELRRRIYAMESGLPHDSIVTGRLNERSWQEFQRAQERMEPWILEINDRRRQSVADIAADARRVATRHGGLDLICVDYIQWVEPVEFKVSREQQVARVTKELHDLAGMMGCPLVTAGQLNEEAKGRTGHKPRMGDLRESKVIEHTASVVLFGWWPWRSDPKKYEMQDFKLIIGKHRGGRPDLDIDCTFDFRSYLVSEGKTAALPETPPQPELAGAKW